MRLTSLLARLLPDDDRDAMLGDHLELGTPAGLAFLDVAGLVAGRASAAVLGRDPAEGAGMHCAIASRRRLLRRRPCLRRPNRRASSH